MPYVGKKPADIIATAVDTTTGDFSGNVTAGGTLGVTGVSTLTGNLLVGGTTTNHQSGSSQEQLSYIAGDYFAVSRSNNDVAFFNRQTSDGSIINLRKNGTTVGSIGVANTDQLTIGTSDGSEMGLRFDGDLEHILPTNASGTKKDALADLGSATARWRNIYFSGSVFLGGTGSANALDDYEEGTWTPTYTGSSGNPTITYDTLTAGYYTKIGRHVFIIGRIRTDACSGGGGVLQVSGLPFTVNSNIYTSGGGVVSNDFGSNNPHSTMAVPSSSVLYLIYGNYNTNNTSDLQDGVNKNQIQFTLHYMV